MILVAASQQRHYIRVSAYWLHKARTLTHPLLLPSRHGIASIYSDTVEKQSELARDVVMDCARGMDMVLPDATSLFLQISLAEAVLFGMVQ